MDSANPTPGSVGPGTASTARSIRRILREWQEIQEAPSSAWLTWPIDPDHPYEWHFTIRGPPDSAFEKGVYHGRMVLPVNYPMAPPSIYFTTINGRFEIHKKVCLSASNYHPETWQPAWGIRSILEALHVFFKTPAEGAVHALDWPDSQRRRYAELSGDFFCPVCQRSNADIIADAPRDNPRPNASAGAGPASLPPVASPPSAGSASSPELADLSGGRSPVQTQDSSVSVNTTGAQQGLDEEARLAEIRRRRQPRTVSATSRANARMPVISRLPHFVIFTGWLAFFASRSMLEFVRRNRVMRIMHGVMRRHSVATVASLLVLGWAVLVLARFACRVYQETWFLFDVPITREWQQVTNPLAQPELGVAERVVSFRIHPWLKQLLDEVRLRRN